MISKRRNGKTSRRGIALIDVIVGALMLGAGLAVIVSLSTRSLAAQTDGEKRMVAAWLADELLSMVLVEGPEEYPSRYDMEGEFYPPFEEFSFRVSIKDNGPGLAHTVTAHVGWQVGRGVNEIAIEAAIAERRGPLTIDEIREPREYVDREQRHYERIFGKDEDEQRGAQPVRVPTNTPGGGTRGTVPPDLQRGGGGGGGR